MVGAVAITLGAQFQLDDPNVDLRRMVRAGIQVYWDPDKLQQWKVLKECLQEMLDAGCADLGRAGPTLVAMAGRAKGEWMDEWGSPL